jgi:hypothetical protein
MHIGECSDDDTLAERGSHEQLEFEPEEALRCPRLYLPIRKTLLGNDNVTSSQQNS